MMLIASKRRGSFQWVLLVPRQMKIVPVGTSSTKTDEDRAYSSKTDENLQRGAYSIIAGVVLWWHILCQSQGFQCGAFSATTVVESQDGTTSTKVYEMLKKVRKGTKMEVNLFSTKTHQLSISGVTAFTAGVYYLSFNVLQKMASPG